MLERENPFTAIRQSVASPEPNALLRLGLSLVGGLFCTGMGLAIAWLYAGGWYNRRVLDHHISAGLLLGALTWCVMLWHTWRPVRGGARLLRPVMGTIALTATAVLAGVVVEEAFGGDEEVIIVALLMFGGAGVVLIWLPVLYRIGRRRGTVDDEGQVAVFCPVCGYSLVGLRELRCPECGTAYALDEVIRAQNYDGVRQANHPASPALSSLPPVVPATP